MSRKQAGLPLTLQNHFKHNLDKFAQDCIRCNLCVEQCAFLQKHGNPGEIAPAFDFHSKNFMNFPFKCSLCELCTIVCPVGLNPAKIFLEMRREIVCRNNFDFSSYKVLLDYERRGISKRYTCYALPRGCDTVFFPGCALAGTRPKQTFQLFNYLKSHIPNLGVVLDCCCKSSHDLGRQNWFRENFNEKMCYLKDKSIKKILAACPGCYKIFKTYGKSIRVETVYEIMSKNGFPVSQNVSGSVCVHDPCAARHDEKIHAAIRHLIKSVGLDVLEMEHSGKNTLCCGEGGAVNFIDPELSGNWDSIRTKGARDKKIITYCAGCYPVLNKTVSVCHIIDLLFEPQAAIKGNIKVYSAPITYLNRILLKHRLKKTFAAGVCGERNHHVRNAPS
jgi:Fe-S oxidoreductase